MSLTDDYNDNVLDALFGGSALSLPADYEVALSTTAPADDGTNITEPVGNGYARVSVTNDLTTWNASSSGVKTNAIDISFPQATGSWGTITHFALIDQSSGDVIFTDVLVTSKTVDNGDIFRFLSGDLEITAD